MHLAPHDGIYPWAEYLDVMQALEWLRSHYWLRLADWIRVSENRIDSHGSNTSATMSSSSEWHDMILEAECRLELLKRRVTDKSHSSAEMKDAEKPSLKATDGRANLPTGWMRKSSYKMRPLGFTSTASLPA